MFKCEYIFNWESNRGPSWCEAAVLTTVLSCAAYGICAIHLACFCTQHQNKSRVLGNHHDFDPVIQVQQNLPDQRELFPFPRKEGRRTESGSL